MRRLIFERLPNRRPLYHLADVRFESGQLTFEHTQDFPELFLVISGLGRHRIDERSEPLEAGCLVLVEAGSRHFFESTRALRVINLAFSPAWWAVLGQLRGPPPEGARGGVQARLTEGPTRECEQHLHALLQADPAAAAPLLETACVLLRHLLHPRLGSALTPVILEAGAPRWLDNLVREMYAAPAPLENITHWQRRSGRSPEHLARTCRRFLGCTLTDLLVRLRLQHVKAGMRAGHEKIAALAFGAGFQNLGYFYRRFQRLEGCSPKQWEARHASDAAVPR